MMSSPIDETAEQPDTFLPGQSYPVRLLLQSIVFGVVETLRVERQFFSRVCLRGIKQLSVPDSAHCKDTNFLAGWPVSF